jgi:FAD dependent oxidoreductase
MRVLIIGGGVAGLALAAMLARQGREPVVVERASSCEESGYGIALCPFGSAVLHGIGAYPAFAAASAELRTYEIAGRRGGVIRSVDFARLMSPYGPTVTTGLPPRPRGSVPQPRCAPPPPSATNCPGRTPASFRWHSTTTRNARPGRPALTSATPAVWPARCSCKATRSAGAATWPPATC